MTHRTALSYKTPIPRSERTKRAIIYVRVSPSGDSIDEHRSSRNQRNACYDKVDELDAVIAEVYEVRGHATTERSVGRPAYQDMLDRIKEQRDADYVIVTTPDRLSRSMNTWADIHAQVNRTGAKLIVVSDGVAVRPAETRRLIDER